ncbi:hypothetical protein GM661_11440 [Iocasia frigidifontis]|uniref:Stage III sporulation protein AB n=1 Tax=Iocasia fonsfrigidae TaxID=2682810 RepID=A0A8A7KEL5_9FIRM|nr:hypothetical protein D7D81_14360 [Halocella sp. SP3-1]QTL98535.1 hypothetical protein GM661_11440 [Iocasia fonsfrigidae]
MGGRFLVLLIKLTGAVMILVSGSFIGWIIGSSYQKRVKELEELEMGINIFNTEISYKQSFMAEALMGTAATFKSPLANLFRETAYELEKGNNKVFYEIWHERLLINYRNNSLLEEDIEILDSWGRQLGSSSLDNQNNINQLILKRLRQQKIQAEKEAAKKVKLVRYAGVLISLMIIILFY